MSQNFWNSNSNINYQELIQYIAQEPDDFAIIEWFNYGILRDSLNTSFSSVINEMYLFPDSAKYQIMDSNMNINYKDVYVHHAGNVLDMKSTNVFSIVPQYSNLSWCPSYIVDSLAVMYKYNRLYSDINVVDTLIVHLYNESANLDLGENFITGAQALNYNTDTLRFLMQWYNQTNNTPTTIMVTPNIFKIPLTINDTSISVYKIKSFFINNFIVNQSVNSPDGLVGTTFTFKPGHPYNAGDTLNLNRNYFILGSLEENGDSTYPTYRDNAFHCSSMDSIEWNISSIIPTIARYSSSASIFTPSYAFNQAFKYEHHMIFYHVVNIQGSVEEELSNNLFKVYPNPCKDILKIDVEEEIESISIYRIDGSLVKTINKYTNNDDIDVKHLKSSIYLLRIINKNKVVYEQFIKN